MFPQRSMCWKLDPKYSNSQQWDSEGLIGLWESWPYPGQPSDGFIIWWVIRKWWKLRRWNLVKQTVSSSMALEGCIHGCGSFWPLSSLPFTSPSLDPLPSFLLFLSWLAGAEQLWSPLHFRPWRFTSPDTAGLVTADWSLYNYDPNIHSVSLKCLWQWCKVSWHMVKYFTIKELLHFCNLI